MNSETEILKLLPAINNDIKKHLEKGNSYEAYETISSAIDGITSSKIIEISNQERKNIEEFCEFIEKLMLNQAYQIPPKLVPGFVINAGTISNLFAITPLKNTDTILLQILNQPDNIAKVLFLYSHRNTLDFNLEILFATNPPLTSLWWSSIINFAMGTHTEPFFNRLIKFISFEKIENYYVAVPPHSNESGSHSYLPYFCVSYIDINLEKRIKSLINNGIKKHISSVSTTHPKLNPNPDMRKIAVISPNMRKHHVVYRNLAPLLMGLRNKYHLTLYHFGLIGELDEVLFDKIIKLDSDNPNMWYEFLKMVYDNAYGIVLYPDIGMNDTTMELSNVRLAPIQICCYGHPVSTWGGEIDYFIGSIASEPRNPERNYSEKLVLIPDIDRSYVSRNYEPKFPDNNSDEVVILCNWGTQKLYYPYFKLIRDIAFETGKKVLFKFLGTNVENFHFIPCKEEIESWFNKDNVRIELLPQLIIEDYLEVLELSDFAIDSYPFGSYNRIIDMLWCRKPVIAYPGDRPYSICGGALLNEIGFNELVVKNESELKEVMTKLIVDEAYRNQIKQKVRALDFNKKVLNNGNRNCFLDAIDYITENHEHLKTQGNEPIIIGGAS